MLGPGRVRIAIGAGLALISLPYWLARAVVGLRTRIFTRINGAEGIAIPGDLVLVEGAGDTVDGQPRTTTWYVVRRAP